MPATSETVSKGHVYSNTIVTDVGDLVLSGGTMLIEAGAIATSTTVDAGGLLIVEQGGSEIGLINSGTTNGLGGVISGPLVNSGLVEARGTDAYLAIFGSAANAKGKTIEAVAAGAGGFAELDISGSINNSGTIAALATAAASNAYVDLSGTLDNTSGRILASGNGVVDLDGATISGGTLQTVGAAAAIAVFPNGSATIDSAAVAVSSLIEADGGALALSAVTFGAHDTLEASDGGTLTIGGSATFGAGTLAKAITGGTLDVSGNVANAGTVEALAEALQTSAMVALSGGSVGNAGKLAALATTAYDSAGLIVDGSSGVINSGSIVASVGAAYGSATATISGGTISNSKIIAAEDTAPSATGIFSFGDGDAATTIDAASITNAGTLEALAVSGGVAGLTAAATTIGNTGAIKVLANSTGQATLLLDGATSNAKAASILVSATGSNSDAGLEGAGVILNATVSNSGTIEALAQAGALATIRMGGTNRGMMLASAGTHGEAVIVLSDVDNAGGRILASAGSGAAAQIVLDEGTVSGGVLQTVGAGAAITVGDNVFGTISDATIAADAHIILGQNLTGVDPEWLTLDNDTFGAGTILEASYKSPLSINGGLTWSAGAVMEAIYGGTISISGNVANAGTIEAIGAGDPGTAISMVGEKLTNAGTIAFLAGPNSNNQELTIAMTGAVVNSGILEIVAAGPGGGLSPGLPTLDVSAGTITNAKTIVASAGLSSDLNVVDYVALNLDAGSGFVNSGTIFAAATANPPLNPDGGEVTVFASIDAGTDIANTGTIATVASSTFAPSSLRIDSAGTVVSAGGNISNGGSIVASATGGGVTVATVSLIAGGTFFNSGTVSAARSSGGYLGAVVDVSIQAATIINTKTIDASQASLTLSAGSITNSGLIAMTGSLPFVRSFLVSGSTLSNAKTGTIETLNSPVADAVEANALVNAGVIKVSATSGTSLLAVDGGTISNGGTAAALGSGPGRAELFLSGTVNNSGGTLLASGNAALDIDGATISGGVLATSGSLAEILVSAGATISAATIAAHAFVEASGGTLTLDSGTVIGKGATVEAFAGGTVEVSGTVTNSGALLAEQGGSVVIGSGAVISHGVAEIGAGGAVVISGDSAENVTFMSGALSGGLYLADTATDSAGYSGTVSGFAGHNGTDVTQFIDLSAVTYSAGVVSAIYTASAVHPTSGGVLAVISGGVTVADITLAGNYTHAAFEVTSGANDTVEITDPPGGALVAGASVTLAATPTTLATTAHQPSLIDYAGASNVALLGSYMASMFGSVEGISPHVTTAAGQNQAVLAHPHTD